MDGGPGLEEIGRALLAVGVLAAAFMAVGSVFVFHAVVAPAALRRWVSDHGYQLLEHGKAGYLDTLRVWPGRGQVVYRMTVRTESGEVREALAVVGNYLLPCLSQFGCPVDVFWQAPRPAPPTSPPREHPLWDRDVD